MSNHVLLLSFSVVVIRLCYQPSASAKWPYDDANRRNSISRSVRTKSTLSPCLLARNSTPSYNNDFARNCASGCRRFALIPCIAPCKGFCRLPPPPPSYMSQNSFPFNPQHTHPLHAAYVLPMYLLCLCVYAYLLSLCISCLPACLCIMPAGHSGGRGRPAGSGGARRARLVRARGGGRAEGVEGRAGRTMDVPCSWVALSV